MINVINTAHERAGKSKESQRAGIEPNERMGLASIIPVINRSWPAAPASAGDSRSSPLEPAAVDLYTPLTTALLTLTGR